jgi:hypothetical protein
VMILFMFVIISFLDEQKFLQWRAAEGAKLRRKRLQLARDARAAKFQANQESSL